MKRIQFFRYMLLAVLTATALTGCRFEDEDYFDESASLRIEHANERIQDILTAPEQGWVMQYFCGTGVAHFEGFNLFASFDKNGKVTLASNHRMLRNGNAGKYTEYTSLYELLLEDGSVLAFNTWNDILTPFVDPVSPWRAPGALAKDGAGMEGDNNFVVMSYKDGEVILRGERHSAEVRLVACDRPWQDYIAACDKTKNDVTNNVITSYYVTAEDVADTLYLTGIRNGRIRYSERLTDPLRADSLAGVFTPTGFRIERENSLGDHKFHEFTVAADSICLQNEDGTVKVIPCWDNYIVSRTSLWKLDPSLFSAEQQSLFEQIDAEVKDYNKNWSLESIGFGRSSGAGAVTGLVLTFYTTAAKTRTNGGAIELSFSRPAYGQMTVGVDAEAVKFDKNMEIITAKAANMTNLAIAFAKTLQGTFTIQPDSYFLPTGGVFTPVGGSAPTFKLN